MIDCAYIGDSIAVGLHQLDTKCAVHAKVGASTDYITKHFIGQGGKKYTIISMGSNNPYSPQNMKNAEKLRASLGTETLVIWVLPYNRIAAGDIQIVARAYGDMWVDLSGYKSKDHVHPTYGPVSKKIKNFVNAAER